MNEGVPPETGPADSEADRDDASWLGFETALPWLMRAVLPVDDGARLAAPAAE